MNTMDNGNCMTVTVHLKVYYAPKVYRSTRYSGCAEMCKIGDRVLQNAKSQLQIQGLRCKL